MATYKVIQDIEAEDHILGPLSLRQFIFGMIAIACFYLCFIALAKHVWILLVIFLPPGLLLTFFAFPWGKDQPTEVWALAKIRFLFKPRRRIWDQSGMKELVTITVPKKIEKVYTDGLSQIEVKSRLHLLADTLDSRGWATKNVNVNLLAQPLPASRGQDSDRLVDPNSFQQEVPSYDVQAADDILDEQNNPTAQQFDEMIGASTRERRQQLVDRLKGDAVAATSPPAGAAASQAADYWFVNQPAAKQSSEVNSAPAPSAVTGSDSQAEQALAERLRAQKEAGELAYSHMHGVKSLGKPATRSTPTAQPATTPPAQLAPPPIPAPKPARDKSGILNLSKNNDLNVATIAREANKQARQSSEDEVVISLH